jgi:hypothetical protein
MTPNPINRASARHMIPQQSLPNNLPPNAPRTVTKRVQIYWGGRHPENYLLAHNPVQPVSERQRHGVNGFRVMWIPPEFTKREKNPFKVCDCGWRPDRGDISA